MTARTPPSDLVAEADLLGAAMLDPAALEIAAGVEPADFYKPAHAHIADVLRGLHDRGEPVDPTTVAYELSRVGLLDVVGGHQALVGLMSGTPATSNAARYAAIVRERAVLRRLIGAAGEIAELAYTGTSDPAQLAAQAAELIEEVATQAQAVGTGGLRLTPASAFSIERPAWAWAGRIPLAGVTLVPGREGEGKTALIGHICARLTRGDLPGDRHGRPGDVIYIGYEDDRTAVLIPRLVAAGADLERFLFVDLPHGVPFTIAVNIGDLARQARARDIAAIVLDPLDAHLGVQDSHKKAEVQAAIVRLAGLTQQLRCAGIGIAHLNKGDHRDVLLKVVGSVGLTTAVRSVLAVGPNPQDPDTEKVAVVRKANMTNARDIPAVRFRVEGTTIAHPTDGGTIDTARVALLGEAHGINADSILALGDPEQRSDLERACDWLQAVLADGPMAKREIVTLARHEDITTRTLERAAERLSVAVDRDKTQRGCPAWWALKDTDGFSATDFSPNPTGEHLARNHTPPDQRERDLFGDYSPEPGTGEKSNTNGQRSAFEEMSDGPIPETQTITKRDQKGVPAVQAPGPRDQQPALSDQTEGDSH